MLDYRVEYEEVLDNLAHKKIKLLKMKQTAEKIQNHKVNLTTTDVDKMLGLPVDNKKTKVNKKYKEDEVNEEDEDMEEEGEEFDEDDSDLEEIEDEDLEDGEEEEDDDEELEIEDQDLAELENEELENQSYNSDDNEGSPALEILSEELKSDSDEEIATKNVHGFLEPENLLTYKKTYREKSADLKNQEKEQYKHKRKAKNGGKTNREQKKNKPIMMVIGKKKRIQSEKMVNYYIFKNYYNN